MTRPCHVLALENDLAIIDLYSQIFLNRGMRFSAARTTESAREILAKERVDLIIIDVVLSDGASGIATAAEFVAEGQRVMLVTGHHDYFDKVEQSGLPFVHKPFRIPALLQQIECELRRGNAQCAWSCLDQSRAGSFPSAKPC